MPKVTVTLTSNTYSSRPELRVTQRLPFQYLLHWGVGEGATPFPGLLHFTLDPYLIMLSAKQGGIKYHWVFMTWSGIEPPKEKLMWLECIISIEIWITQSDLSRAWPSTLFFFHFMYVNYKNSNKMNKIIFISSPWQICILWPHDFNFSFSYVKTPLD